MFFRFTKYFLFAGLFVSLLFIIKAVNAVESFKDMNSHWAASYAEALRQNCQINGYKDKNGNYLNEFRPNLSITRAELVKMLVQCKNGELINTGDSFSDVNGSEWFAPAISQAKKSGWVTGYTDGTFKPGNLINRAEALKIILLSAFPDSEIKGGNSHFSDVGNEWFSKYVKFAVLKSYVNGYSGGTFGPGNNLTRGEAAKIISKVNGYVAETAEPINNDVPSSGNPPKVGNCQIFPSDNPWNTDVSQYPVDPNSDNYIKSINAGRQYLHADFGSNSDYGIPYNIVGAGQKKVPVSAGYPDESDLPSTGYPIPQNAKTEAGSDGHVIVVDKDNCVLYETFASNFNGTGWDTGSAAIFDLKSNNLRTDYWTSADAAGLPIYPGLVKYDEVKSGEITHAVRFTVSKTQRGFIHPATHFASSSTDTNRPPMGLRLRLKADFDLSGFHGDSLVILQALKKYGMILADNGSDWFITGETNTNWNDDDLNQLKSVPGSAFEAVETGEIIK